MNWVIARCSYGQSYALQCKSFKLLCVIPDPFFSFKHKPETAWKYFLGRRKLLDIAYFCSSVCLGFESSCVFLVLFSFKCFIFP